MKKLKITQEQYERLIKLNESKDVKGGINRVNTSFKKTINQTKVKNLSEEPFDIKASDPTIPNSKMKPKKETTPINEDVFSPEMHKAISDFIQNIWLNPSQRGLSTFFVKNGITWGDLISYLTSVGIVTGVGAGIYKVNNFFKRHFSKNKEEANQQKIADIEKMANLVSKDPNAPWSANKLIEPESKEKEVDEGDGGYPMGAAHDSNAPWNQDNTREPRPAVDNPFSIVGSNREVMILNSPSGLYLFDASNIPNGVDTIDVRNIEDYINDNFYHFSKGEGIEGFEKGADLVKIDDSLKNELLSLYSKDKRIVDALSKLQEMTSAASSGAFTGPLGGTPNKTYTGEHSPANELKNIKESVLIKEFNFREAHNLHKKYDKDYDGRFDVDKATSGDTEETIEEMTAAGGGTGDATSSTTGAYVQPKIWAKNKANWAAAKKTQYPKGEMVDIDSCAKLNNNKSAQNGKCNQGAKDGAVKTHRTKQSVISKTVYEQIAEKTGRTVEDVKNIIETKLNKNNPLR